MCISDSIEKLHVVIFNVLRYGFVVFLDIASWVLSLSNVSTFLSVQIDDNLYDRRPVRDVLSMY